MRFIVANLAVTAVNLLITLSIQICMALRIPPPDISIGWFIAAVLIISAIVWTATFHMLADVGTVGAKP